MARRMTDESKLKHGRGTGIGADYVPWIYAREFNGSGTTAVIPDWKHGRGIQCLSQGEAMWYYILRWDDGNIDIREQFPLLDAEHTMAETQRIAKELGYRGTGHVMSTDFLVTERGGTYRAYAVKADRNLSRRDKEKLKIEAEYWCRRGVPFTLLYKEDADGTLATNIRLAVRYYDKKNVFDGCSMIKHMIATKQYTADLSAGVLDAARLKQIYKDNEGRRFING